MEDAYIIILTVLFALSVTDLVVGVSNDAVNFLNSAIGSKALPLRTVLVVASLGVLIGSVFSSGLMEVAREGIFLPGKFYFDEIIIIFMAVMITDVLLLDFFNSLGFPTSTTVSIVFELLGAAVCVALLKIINGAGGFSSLPEYINMGKATEIVIAIFLSIIIAFLLGAVIQYFSRVIFSFQYDRNLRYSGAIFGGVSLTAITYFILIKGLNNIAFIPEGFNDFVREQSLLIIISNLLLFTLLSQFVISVLKANLLKIIIVVGTFALALAFAGNDLVNFIGVPIAAWQSYGIWQEAYSSGGVLPEELLMSDLSAEVRTPEIFLVLAGIIMVLTLWFSRKVMKVTVTELELARQGHGEERFDPTTMSRVLVRYFSAAGGAFRALLPRRVSGRIDNKFRRDELSAGTGNGEVPAFDLLRAAVNLVVASVLIAIATNLTLPLSTTYVTFMVAMGTSLADRAWDRESAVYRVAGVMSITGSWFITAFVAFAGAAILALLIYFGGMIAMTVLVLLALFFVVRSAVLQSRKIKADRSRRRFKRSDIRTINEIAAETSHHIARIIGGVNKRYSMTVEGLGYHDLGRLKKNSKSVEDLESEIDELKENIFYFIKSVEEESVEASKFYILILDHLQNMVRSAAYITRSSYNHVENHHKNLKFNQIRDLKRVEERMQLLFDEIVGIFEDHSYHQIDLVIAGKQQLLDQVSELIEKQINRIRTSETSPKNTKLYFGILLETRDLVTSAMNLLQLFKDFYVEAEETI